MEVLFARLFCHLKISVGNFKKSMDHVNNFVNKILKYFLLLNKKYVSLHPIIKYESLIKYFNV